MGNRTAKTDNVTGNETYAFDAANRITTRQVGTSAVINYISDANGNTTSRDNSITPPYPGEERYYSYWDSQNRLVNVGNYENPDDIKSAYYDYGADGLRRSERVI